MQGYLKVCEPGKPDHVRGLDVIDHLNAWEDVEGERLVIELIHNAPDGEPDPRSETLEYKTAGTRVYQENDAGDTVDMWRVVSPAPRARAQKEVA